MSTDRMMPQYRSHKIVWALHIAALEIHLDGSATIAPKEEGYAPFRTPPGWAERFLGDEEDLGVFVAYEGGHTSWSPTQAFIEGYRPISGATGMDFGGALNALRNGKKLARTGWNGKGQFVVMMPALYLPPYNSQEPGAKVNDRTAKYIGEDAPLDSQPYFAMRNAQGKWQPGWVPSVSDCLATDWTVVE